MTTSHTIIDTQVGDLTLVAAGGVLTGVYYPGHWTNPDRTAFGPRSDEGFDEAERQLGEYLAGERTAFELRDVRRRATTFQQRVWALLERASPTARRRPTASSPASWATPRWRATVGRAVGSNPLSVIVPCHRVVGKDGKLTGYAGGLERKRFLLELEGLPVAAEPARLF